MPESWREDVSFEERNASENLDALAAELVTRLDDAWLAEAAPGSLAEEKDRLRGAIERDDAEEMLEAFRSYFLGKLTGAAGEIVDTAHESEAKTLHMASMPGPIDLDEEVAALRDGEAILGLRAHSFTDPGPSRANLATLNRKTRPRVYEELDVDVQRVEIGQPGAVEWDRWDKDTGEGDIVTEDDRNPAMWHLDPFAPLLISYIETGDADHLEQWCAYADDWALNQDNGYEVITPFTIDDENQANWGVRYFLAVLKHLRKVADRAGPDEDVLPAATLARVLLNHHHYLYPSLAYAEASPQNWVSHLTTELTEAGALLSEFTVGRLCLERGRRRLEDYAYLHRYPDGTTHQHSPNYDTSYFNALEALEVWERLEPEWLTPEWQRELDEHVEVAVRWRTVCHMADGRYPIGLKDDGRHHSIAEVLTRIPEEFSWPLEADPDLERILNRGLLTSSMNMIETLYSMEPPEGYEPPSFTSEAFPYGGYRFMREGWELDDHFGFLFCAMEPGINDRQSSANNFFGLRAFGQDLLVAGKSGQYSSIKTPVTVDGESQFFHAGIPTWHHRGYLGETSDEPGEERWHTSEAFDVAEGTYSGPYGEGYTDSLITEDHADNIAAAAEACIRDVTHNRLVQYLKAPGVWIVTDRLDSPADHEYTQRWYLPTPPIARGWNQEAFDTDDIEIDAAARTITTQAEAIPNVSMYQTGPELEYDTSVHEHDLSTKSTTITTDESSFDWGGVTHHYEIAASWRDHGQPLVTLVYPRRTIDDTLTSVTRTHEDAEGAAGITATLGDDSVSYVAADDPRSLELGAVRATAESVLVTDAIDGDGWGGVALGCADLEVDGHPVETDREDFEFTLSPDVAVDIGGDAR